MALFAVVPPETRFYEDGNPLLDPCMLNFIARRNNAHHIFQYTYTRSEIFRCVGVAQQTFPTVKSLPDKMRGNSHNFKAVVTHSGFMRMNNYWWLNVFKQVPNKGIYACLRRSFDPGAVGTRLHWLQVHLPKEMANEDPIANIGKFYAALELEHQLMGDLNPLSVARMELSGGPSAAKKPRSAVNRPVIEDAVRAAQRAAARGVSLDEAKEAADDVLERRTLFSDDDDDEKQLELGSFPKPRKVDDFKPGGLPAIGKQRQALQPAAAADDEKTDDRGQPLLPKGYHMVPAILRHLASRRDGAELAAAMKRIAEPQRTCYCTAQQEADSVTISEALYKEMHRLGMMPNLPTALQIRVLSILQRPRWMATLPYASEYRQPAPLGALVDIHRGYLGSDKLFGIVHRITKTSEFAEKNTKAVLFPSDAGVYAARKNAIAIPHVDVHAWPNQFFTA
jgi:hypothetical protein